MKRRLIAATTTIKLITLYQIVAHKKHIYQANINCGINKNKQKCYLGLVETVFKERFGDHKK